MAGDIHIGAASRELGVTPEYLRLLERRGRVPRARRDWNGRVYGETDLRFLKALGVGFRPRRLKTAAEALEAAR
jgi:DNA-binding transcriptional MerR regulator